MKNTHIVELNAVQVNAVNGGAESITLELAIAIIRAGFRDVWA